MRNKNPMFNVSLISTKYAISLDKSMEINTGFVAKIYFASKQINIKILVVFFLLIKEYFSYLVLYYLT